MCNSLLKRPAQEEVPRARCGDGIDTPDVLACSGRAYVALDIRRLYLPSLRHQPMCDAYDPFHQALYEDCTRVCCIRWKVRVTTDHTHGRGCLLPPLETRRPRKNHCHQVPRFQPCTRKTDNMQNPRERQTEELQRSLSRQTAHARTKSAPLGLERNRADAALAHAKCYVVQTGECSAQIPAGSCPEQLRGGRSARPNRVVEVRGA